MSRLRVTALAGVAAILTIFTASGTPDFTIKLDRALRDWVRHPASATVRTLVHARPGTVSRVHHRLERLPSAKVGPSTTPNLIVAELSPADLSAAASDPDVTRISTDALVRSLGSARLTSDILLNTEALLPRAYNGDHVGVAVIDSGIQPNENVKVGVAYDFVARDGRKVGSRDPYGHGTHVSGLIASKGKSSHDLYESIAPAVKLISLRVLDENGTGYTSDVIDAINFAVEHKDDLGVDVINLSLGHPVYEPAASDPLVQAVENAVAAGIVVVASAGNYGGDPTTHEPGYAGITSPGNAPSAITVGALDTNNTVARDDDTVAWYSSRGPTWYDAFQKPDIVAPGSHLVSDVPDTSTIARAFPRGLINTKGATNLMQLSGTSMAAAVVTGTVALVLDASRSNFHDATLAPNAVKAILQYSAFPMANYDMLTQGAGSLNAAGAVTLAEVIDPRLPVSTWWLTTGVNTWTTVGGDSLAWGQRVVWGDRVIWGNQIYTNDPAWALRVVWGDRVIWGNRVVWGNSTIWGDGNPAVWGSRVIWGNNLLGETDGTTVTWGSLSGNISADRVVWGDISSLNIAPTALSWSNLHIANADLVDP